MDNHRRSSVYNLMGGNTGSPNGCRQNIRNIVNLFNNDGTDRKDTTTKGTLYHAGSYR